MGRPANVKSELKGASSWLQLLLRAVIDSRTTARRPEVRSSRSGGNGHRLPGRLSRAANTEVERLIARIARIRAGRRCPLPCRLTSTRLAVIRGKAGEPEAQEVRFSLRIVKGKEGA